MRDGISTFSSPNGLTTTMAVSTDGQVSAAQDCLPETGTRVGGEDGQRFELVDLLGRGAMGAVFLARDHLLERTVAVKFIIHSGGHASRDTVVELFRQEARATARLNHENIVQVFDLGTWNGTPFLVMEHMVGQALDSLVRPGEPFDTLRATHVVADIARGLAHAHRAGIVHRDLKPSNIFILKDGRAKILDFGVATITQAQGPSSSALIAGTPLYMSPEQWLGEQQDGRADLWAAGMLFFELLTGSTPTDERDLRLIRAQMLSPEPLRSVRDLRPELPEEANALVGRALSKDKEQRFASADEFLDAVVGLEMVLKRALRAASHSDQSAEVTPRASQRQVTLVSFRLVRLAALAEELDLEAFADLCAGFFESGRTVVRQLEGAVVSAAGGHLLAGFGYPVAHEDDAQRAVRAALLVIEGVRGIARQIGANAAVRVGVHTGAVLVGRDRADEGAILQGDAPEIAAWLSQIAEPDTIVVSERTAALTSWLFDISSLGARTPSDGGPVMEVLRVDRQRPVASRFEQAALSGLTPLVGREADVEQLEALWAKTRAGKGQFVLVAGEAGIGKSRLVEELKDAIVGRAGTRLTGQCWPYFSNAAFHPLIEVAQRSMEIVPEDPPADKIHKLEKLLRTLGLPLHDHVPPLANLLSIPMGAAYPPLNLNPDMFKLRLLDSLSEVLLRSSEARPMLLVIEDVHWSDESTQQLLGMLLDRIVNARLLVLLSFRPEYQHAWPLRAHLHRIEVTRLPSRVTAALVALASRGRSLPEEVIATLVARTDGIPLFVEELTRMVVESWPSGAGAAGGTVETAAAGDSVQFLIPATLHELLLARLDRLAGAGKDVAQLGAVLGREFTFKLIERASHIDGDHLRDGLMQLVEAGLIRRQEHPTGMLYVFKHALVQEAAYGSLLRTDRKRHHRRVAEAIERDFTDVAAQQPELLAHHFAEAGVAEQAIAYLDKAGARAVQRSAHTDAISHYQRAIALVDELPDSDDRARTEVRLRLALGTPLMAVRGFAHADCEANYARAIALCRSLGDDSQVFPATLGLWQFSMVRGRLALSIDLGRTLLSQAEATRDRTSIMFAHRALGTSSLLVGDLVGGRDHTTRGLALYDPNEHGALWARFGHDPGVAHGLYLGWSLALLGHMDQAVAAARGALHLARSQQQPASVAFALCYLCIIENHRGDFSSALDHADQAARVSADHSLALWAAMSRIQRGWALLGLGELERGTEILREGVKGWMGTGAFTGVSFFGAVQAWGHLLRDRVDEAERAIEEGTELENRNGEHFYGSELVRLRGDVIRVARPHDVAEAEAQYRRALEIADSQSAHTFAIKTAVSLGRLLADTGRGAEARALVESTTARFTEGFDTVDLVNARAFIDQLPAAHSQVA